MKKMRAKPPPPEPKDTPKWSVTFHFDGYAWVIVTIPDAEVLWDGFKSVLDKIADHYGSKGGPTFIDAPRFGYFFSDGISDASQCASAMMGALSYGPVKLVKTGRKLVVRRL